MTLQPIFDGHNDLLARLYMAGGLKAVDSFVEGRQDGHLDADKVRRGGFAAGFFAIWVPSIQHGRSRINPMARGQYDLPLPPPVDQDRALQAALIQAQTLQALERINALTICTSTQAVDACRTNNSVAAIMHMEGADAIDLEFEALERLYALGLRSLGLVWSRPTRFAHGVPFRFPGSPDTGPGLTDDGRRLVAQCNRLGVAIDLSHLTEAGFWDVAALSDAPLIATHSNAHALCPHARNLTDKQLDAIAERKGVVGLNFATAFLRSDGKMISNTPVTVMLDHLDHLLARLGEDGVALGSDFDGAIVPSAIGDASGLPVLVEAMRTHGYGENLINKICWQNWVGVLARTWKDAPVASNTAPALAT